MKYDFPISLDVPILGESIMKPLHGKKPHVLFVNSIRFGREVAELLGRFDFTWDSVTYDRSWDVNKWGFGDFYEARGGIWDFRVIHQNLEEALTADVHYDVLVIPGINGWGEFSEPTRRAILKRVENGAGLVSVHPFDGEKHPQSEAIAKLSPLQPLCQEGFDERGYADIAHGLMKSAKWTAEAHYVTRGVDFGLIPTETFKYYPYEAVGEVILRAADGTPVAAVKEYGKGRIIAFGYYARDFAPQHKDFTGQDSCFNPILDTWNGAVMPEGTAFMEQIYRLFGRAILWAARLDCDGIQGCLFANGALTVQAAGDVSVCLRSAYGEVIAKKQSMNGAVFALPDACNAGGRFVAELTLEENGAIKDIYNLGFTTPPVNEVREISADQDVCRNGDTVTGRVRLATSGEVVLRLYDDYGRVIGVQTLFAESGGVAYAFTLKAVLAIHVHVEAGIEANGYTVHKMCSSDITVTPETRNLSDFEVFMNPQNRGIGDLLPYINKIFPEIGMTGNFVGDNRLAAMSGGKGLGVYWYDRAPYVANKEKFLQTKDKKYLQRTPCLNDETFWDMNRKNIQTNVGNGKKYGPIAYFAQDEGSLTCYTDELELCFCPHCMSGMREWLKTQYADLPALNRSWNRQFALWDEVEPYTTAEARKTRDFASWGDHRRFMELTYANSYKRFSELIRAVDPEGRVRMSGCQSSTAFSGNDYELLHRYVRYFEAYPGGNQYEYHRSFMSDDTILGGWFGYGASGVSVQRRIWHALYHRLTLISIFWEYQSLNHDFTFSKSAVSMGKAFKEIRREGIGKLLLYAAKQDTLGVAVHYSMNSVHGTTINGRRLDFENNRQGWLDVLEDMGYQYKFVSADQIENGKLSDGFKMLILPYSIAISPQEAEAIRVFAEKGGVVIGDVQTGLMDGHCKEFEQGCLDDLFGIKRLTTDYEYFYICEGFTVNPAFRYFDYEMKHTPGKEDIGPGVQIAEVGTRADTGVAAYVDGFAGKAASIVVNEIGKGKGIYLNFALKDYPKDRKKEGGGRGLREILSHVFALSDVKKTAVVTDAENRTVDGGMESYYYKLGSSDILCLQKALNEEVEVNYDGLTINREDNRPLVSEAIVVRMEEARHVYDIRKKTYLGHTSEIKDSITEGDTALYALLKYKAEGLSLTASAVTAGQVCRVAGGLAISGEAPAAFVFAVTVTDPKGAYAAFYSKNILSDNGSFAIDISFAHNDCPGDWRVMVKDVATGTEASAIVTLAQ